MTKKFEYCGQPAYAPFRRQAGKDSFTGCVLEPQHAGNHLYGVRVRHVNHQVFAVQFYEETNRQELKPVMFMEVAAGQYTDEELAAFYQYMQYVREIRAAKEVE